MDPVIIVVLCLIVYFALNIVGTVYYTKLSRESSAKSVGLVTVILGWVFFPIFNIYSPIAYASQ